MCQHRSRLVLHRLSRTVGIHVSRSDLLVATRSIGEGHRILAFTVGSAIWFPTQHHTETHAHKVEIGKLLVAESDRGRGLGRKLMNVAESFAQDNLAKNMVLLDTATESPAREFYLKLGYTEWGICPQYAASADGHIHESSFFYKYLSILERDKQRVYAVAS
ncbi:uncharacterized protein CLUP02_03293 [Colletotrichum lupini]|uniref:N-acetyltransferase domain-containing protein n=1 Tax=Colletotrichum lupini TaxID=145971 RepID=A0A9Q8SJV1_9PEZI|nr:uncharacterized protein CLUP02_03293 [Colletotrichum lupini]UQC77822.1 hypothetical protein CLUP02_03293 [Colletotrichum lupini]